MSDNKFMVKENNLCSFLEKIFKILKNSSKTFSLFEI